MAKRERSNEQINTDTSGSELAIESNRNAHIRFSRRNESHRNRERNLKHPPRSHSPNSNYAKKRRKLSFTTSSHIASNQPELANASSSSSPAKFLEEDQFRKLDNSKPAEARRVQQRLRTIMKGKNTVGYDEYIQKVPKERRIPRYPQHPRTPDHTLDIPNRRWLGLVKAWRISIHQYDPEDLQTTFPSSNNESNKNTNVDGKVSTTTESTLTKAQSVQEREIIEASTKGLLVDFRDENVEHKQKKTAPQDNHGTPSSSVDDNGVGDRHNIVDDRNQAEAMADLELDKWEEDHKEDFLDFEEDSDDDLL